MAKVMKAGRQTLGKSVGTFLSTNNPQSREAAIESLEYHSGPRQLLIAGEMCVDQARQLKDADDRLYFLGRARTAWEHLIINEQILGLSSPEAHKARLHIAQLPSYHWLVWQQRLTPPEHAQRVYRQTLEAALPLSVIDLTQANVSNKDRQKHSAGLSAEAATLLLLKRFGAQHGEGQWEAFPSFFSEDQGIDRPSDSKRNWDISVYTHYDETTPPNLQYKIQVKSSLAANNTSYADDIALIGVRENLGLNYAISSPAIIRECAVEAGLVQADYDPTPILDARTEKLLELID